MTKCPTLLDELHEEIAASPVMAAQFQKSLQRLRRLCYKVDMPTKELTRPVLIRRVPVELHRRIKVMAAEHELSMERLVVELLEAGLRVWK